MWVIAGQVDSQISLKYFGNAAEIQMVACAGNRWCTEIPIKLGINSSGRNSVWEGSYWFLSIFYHYTPIAHGYILHGMYSNQSGLRIVFGVVGSLIMGNVYMIWYEASLVMGNIVGNGKYCNGKYHNGKYIHDMIRGVVGSKSSCSFGQTHTSITHSRSLRCCDAPTRLFSVQSVHCILLLIGIRYKAT